MYEYKAHIVSVYDGDTIRADIDVGFSIIFKNIDLRLFGINAPEMVGVNKLQGTIARDALRKRILDKDVVIQTYKDKQEKYGRYLATVLLEGENINAWLVANKYAVAVNYQVST